jgi:hypothetical protein
VTVASKKWNVRKEGLMPMMRAILLMLVAIGMIINGIGVYGKEPTAIEKTGLAYKYLGANGVSEAMLAVGGLFLLSGFLVARHQWKKYKKNRTMEMDV